MKIRCDKCSAIATWVYDPVGEPYLCDLHVPRGCSCNMKYHDELDANGDPVPVLDEAGNYVELTDEQGRLYPCCEWYHEPFGHNEFDEDAYYRFVEENPEINEY